MRVLSEFFTRIAERYLPDAFVFVFLLSALTFVLGMTQGYGPAAVAGFWGDGFFKILTFTAQSTLVLATGFALAHAHGVHRCFFFYLVQNMHQSCRVGNLFIFSFFGGVLVRHTANTENRFVPCKLPCGVSSCIAAGFGSQLLVTTATQGAPVGD